METCSLCKKPLPILPENHTGGTGYALKDKEEKICYDCCAERDKQQMRDKGKIALYLTFNPHAQRLYRSLSPYYQGGKITNWPGTLTFTTNTIYVGRHNIAEHLYRCYFTFENQKWIGRQYGDNTMLLHCKKLKGRTK